MKKICKITRILHVSVPSEYSGRIISDSCLPNQNIREKLDPVQLDFLELCLHAIVAEKNATIPNTMCNNGANSLILFSIHLYSNYNHRPGNYFHRQLSFAEAYLILYVL